MLRPERMSKVSVTGAKSVMPEVIEATHDLNVLHLSDYDGRWEAFGTGDPIPGAEDASERLVTVRALESTLAVTEEDAGPARIVDEDVDERLEEVRTAVNELDDRRSELRDERRTLEERIGAAEPFVDLGIDLDLLSGYDSLQVAVGEGDPDAVERAVADTAGVSAFEVFAGDDTLAVFVYPGASAPEDLLEEALVGVDFSRFEVPDAEGDPEAYVADLERERRSVASKLESVEADLEDLRHEHGDFLLAVEEKLSIEVQKAEAPLNFATSKRAFVAEGWIPTEEYTEFVTGLRDAVGDHVEIEELERAEYTESGHEHEAVADGGYESVEDSPPVVQDNPGFSDPFELLVRVIGRPSYDEFDPTVVLFLTFPLFYGFMIGDLGYGILYAGIGYWLYSSFDSDAIRSLGGIAMWAGGFTALFGVLYGELFGLHVLGEVLFGGSPPLHKGLQPHYINFAKLWLVMSLVAAVVHLGVGYALDFLKTLPHGVKDAVLESGSWLLMLFGLWAWVFSTHLAGPKPAFLFQVLNEGGADLPGSGGDTVAAETVAISLGFGGFPDVVGVAGLAAFALGFVLLAVGDLIEAVEFTHVFAHVLSYTRLAAVLLAKAGMALAVNLLVFGAYAHGGEFHFITLSGRPEDPSWIIFEGLFNMGIAGIAFGLLLLVVGHLLVLALGVTSAGLQAVRLEYVEFFGKFYEGGGENYRPFGYQRRHTTED